MSRVLVVDDEPDVRLMMRMALRLAGHDVEEADSGSAAIDALSREAFEAVVLDVHLPDMTGWDVLERLHRSPSRRSTPVVIVTADVSQGEPGRMLGVGSGADDGGYVAMLYKPMHPDELLLELDRALAQAS